MNTHIVLVSANKFTNGKEVAENVMNHEFVDTIRVHNTLLKELEFDDGEAYESGDILIYHLSDFIVECNEQMINLENYWIANVTIN